ncbi:MFS transporter, DHA1 family, chloramphenicol resistance protein [Streptomyces zhaozhouensis]|uniref:MFS transporter, DHA1 family, chloramphenicol resistance protein n=2 Tax=Streptomyces zhaozhouensis TaxID=1300267 RepID=A0A286E549_9ACTN|nr:Cmx/CmrA family chloramphenicol efflux MFS transporter [Streptomyces zhaozhouensis]SOD66035.1 MFS transporter, DHA1 family, chloramphenicol resistance protein [Streptomyces zhaozhouensis]
MSTKVEQAARFRLPPAVLVIGGGVFALGTSEFMLSGLLPEVADDLDVSIPSAGLLISAFAIGMVVGAPVLAAATQRLPRRLTLVVLLTVFGVSHVVGALAPTYGLLFATRVVSALACAGFWAVGAAVAVSLVPVNARARALAVLLGGLSVANIAGVPGGALLGQHLGWRAAFWAVAALTVLGLVGVVRYVPRTGLDGAQARVPLRTELRVYRDRRVWLAVATTALFAAGTFCFFSYLAPLLTDVTGLGEGWVPFVLVLYGVGALIGTAIGGRLADAHLFGTLYAGLAAATVVLGLLALSASRPAVVVPLAGLLGLAAFLCGPGLNARIFHVAAAAPTLAGATATAAFNTGNTVGPWAGGVVIDAGLGYPWTAWLGAVLLLMALGGAGLQARGAAATRRGGDDSRAGTGP